MIYVAHSVTGGTIIFEALLARLIGPIPTVGAVPNGTTSPFEHMVRHLDRPNAIGFLIDGSWVHQERGIPGLAL
jgi:hypothetical protein